MSNVAYIELISGFNFGLCILPIKLSSLWFQVRLIIDKFGISAFWNAWYDSDQVSEHILQGYTKVIFLKAFSSLSHDSGMYGDWPFLRQAEII